MRGHNGKVAMVGHSRTGVSQGGVLALNKFDIVHTDLVLKPPLALHPDVSWIAGDDGSTARVSQSELAPRGR